MDLFRPHYSFLQTQAWQKQSLNALRYNTSQVGSVVPMIYGTVRQAVNLIAFGGYRGPGGGKKGKGVGPLPIGGTSQTAKGGGGGKKGGKKGPPDFSIDVDFGVCEGPIGGSSSNKVWASAEVTTFGQLPLVAYLGWRHRRSSCAGGPAGPSVRRRPPRRCRIYPGGEPTGWQARSVMRISRWYASGPRSST